MLAVANRDPLSYMVRAICPPRGRRRAERPARMLSVAAALPIRSLLERRYVVLLAAAAMFLAVFVLRQTDADPRDPVALLYVIPILLVALELGVVAALLASVLALILVGVWLLTSQADFDPISNFSYLAAYLAVGAPAGRFADRMRDAQARHRLLLESGLSLAQLNTGGEIANTLAAQAQRIVGTSAAFVDLDDEPSPERAGAPAAGDDKSFPLVSRGVRYGTLRLGGSRPLDADDRATLAILALQAAVAAENQRLLRSERERAAIQAELQVAQLHLAERHGQLREFLTRQEAERDHVAHELHEDAAQVLAAVLLGLGRLERDLDPEHVVDRCQELRADITGTLQSLRSLAVSLSPPALRLGLKAGLEQLAEAARARGFGEVTVAVSDLSHLTPETQTMAYRVVEEALRAFGTPREASIRTDADQLVVELHDPDHEIADDQLKVLKARVELSEGTLSATENYLRAAIPLRNVPDQDVVPSRA